MTKIQNNKTHLTMEGMEVAFLKELLFLLHFLSDSAIIRVKMPINLCLLRRLRNNDIFFI